jgi:hypothetical protein
MAGVIFPVLVVFLCVLYPVQASDWRVTASRAYVGIGQFRLMSDAILVGEGGKTFGFYVLGPSLASPNLPGTLQDPTLTLVEASDGTLIEYNDDWVDSPNSDEITRILQALGISLDPREPVILANLQPGNYRAIAAGANDTTGIAQLGIIDLSGFLDLATGTWLGTGICFNVAQDRKSLTSQGSLCSGGAALVVSLNVNFCAIDGFVMEDVPIVNGRFTANLTSPAGGQSVTGSFVSNRYAEGTATVVSGFNRCDAPWSAQP